ncbi:30S ribosomal protein S17 [Candidatus Berkelbacteria bacterium]|nr:30S ribosomal protein S17 [Candidatus Berkelbacteria bacterium]
MAKRRLTGVVAKATMEQTAIVVVSQVKVHPLYHKRYLRHTRFPAHNPANQFQVGDIVHIEEHRPLSKTKHWLIRSKVGTQSTQLADDGAIDEPVVELPETTETA